MELNFKDKSIKKYFEENKSQVDKIKEVEKEEFLSQMKEDKEILVSSNPLNLDYLEEIDKNIVKEKTQKKIPKTNKEVTPKLDYAVSSDNLSTSQLNRIESKQNAILEILECMPVPTVSQVKLNEIKEEELDCFALNLKLFSSKLIILSSDFKNKNIKEILENLKDISESLISNSFYSFTKETSIIKKTIKKLDSFGVSNSNVNKHLDEVVEILNNMNNASKLNYFEQSIFYSTLFLDKGYTLNAITLLNEATGIYIIESTKKMSSKILKYTSLIGEQHDIKLNSQVKDFFINLFLEDKKTNQLVFFPHHKVVKDIDIEIKDKLKRINQTWSNKGDDGLFKKYAYIITMVRKIRNKLAHVNMDVDFKSLENQIRVLNEDFKYLTIQKNILKR